jgi:hypothetical protein
MKIIDQSLSPETQAIVDSLASGKPVDPEIAKRIHEKAAKSKSECSASRG